VLYFASSIVTWVDREERANDIDTLREQVEAEIRQLEETATRRSPDAP